ncbi:MAG TPA: carboxypeptidase-like regulatory domain-containing protein [Polyangia bacterium]|nr:carboxypeptidase-like regulatory domain-containing protein [Polyangia bacterium]
MFAACNGTDSSSNEALTQTTSALSADAGTITISGTVTDPLTGPQAGITITLSGSAQAQIVTNFGGSFSFSVAPGGSYSITAAGNDNFFQPPFHSCLTVTPSIVNLNNLTQSTNIAFVGSGTDPILNCSPAAATGANSGSLTIAGKVTSGGQPVAGARVMLNGSTQGYRTTDETGAYSFAVNPGSYSVNPSGTCGSYSPTVTNLNNLKANATASFQGASCPPAPLTFCPALDSLVGLSEPASCNTASSVACANDRLSTWAGEVVFDFQNLESDVLAANDCRFGKWQQAPIVNDFTFVGVIEQQSNNLSLFTLQLFGCALTGNLTGPLSLQGSLIPPDLIQAGLKFTTADLSALEDEYMASITQALADFGLPPLSTAQMTAIRAQLDFAASKTPGVIASSTLSYSTCP